LPPSPTRTRPSSTMHKLGHDANKKASKEKAAPSAALPYRTMWCRPALFARLFTTDPTAAR
jgi:hypothetical protein